MRGKQAETCLCSSDDQAAHYQGVTYLVDDESAASRLEELRQWLANFLSSNEGLTPRALSMAEVETAYKTLTASSPSVDGVSRKVVDPLLPLLLPCVHLLFQSILKDDSALTDWQLSSLVSVKKKGRSRTDMHNYRGIHILPFLRQWFVMCCTPELKRVIANKVPSLQQGFIKGRRMSTAYLTLYALIEKAYYGDNLCFARSLMFKKRFPRCVVKHYGKNYTGTVSIPLLSRHLYVSMLGVLRLFARQKDTVPLLAFRWVHGRAEEKVPTYMCCM